MHKTTLFISLKIDTLWPTQNVAHYVDDLTEDTSNNKQTSFSSFILWVLVNNVIYEMDRKFHFKALFWGRWTQR